jgi:hypothetical protein
MSRATVVVLRLFHGLSVECFHSDRLGIADMPAFSHWKGTRLWDPVNPMAQPCGNFEGLRFIFMAWWNTCGH